MSFNIIGKLVHKIQLKQVQAFDAQQADDKEARQQLRKNGEMDITELMTDMVLSPEDREQQQSQSATTTQEPKQDERPKEPAVPRGSIPPPPTSE